MEEAMETKAVSISASPSSSPSLRAGLHTHSHALKLYRRSASAGTSVAPTGLSINLDAVSPVPMAKLASMRRQQEQQRQDAAAGSETGGGSGSGGDGDGDGGASTSLQAKPPGRMSVLEMSVPGMFRPDGHDQRHHSKSPAQAGAFGRGPLPTAKVECRPPWLAVSPKADMFGHSWRPSGTAYAPTLSMHACINQQVVEVGDRTRYFHGLRSQEVHPHPAGDAKAEASKKKKEARGWTEEKCGGQPHYAKELLGHMHPHHLCHDHSSFAPHYLPTSAHAHDDITLRESAFLRRAKQLLRAKYGSGRRSRSADSISKEDARSKEQVYANIRRVVAAEEAAGVTAGVARLQVAAPMSASATQLDAAVHAVPTVEVNEPEKQAQGVYVDSRCVHLSPASKEDSPAAEAQGVYVDSRCVHLSPASKEDSPAAEAQGVYVDSRCVHLSPASEEDSPAAEAQKKPEEQKQEEAGGESKESPFSPAPVRTPKQGGPSASTSATTTPQQDDYYFDDFEEEEEHGALRIGMETAEDKVSPFSPLAKEEEDKISPFSPVRASTHKQHSSHNKSHKPQSHKGDKKGKRVG